jgi:glycosyltransferase involved in cell wall biosynthesis
MKILFLCNKSPYPPKEGGPLAMNANIEGLKAAGHYIKVLAMNTNKYFVPEKEIPEEYRQRTGIELIYIDLSVKPLAALMNLFSSSSLHVDRFISREFDSKLTDVLKNEEFDIVQLEMLYMSPYIETIRKHSKAKIILRSHNIEHLIWNRISKKTNNPLRKVYLEYLTRKLKNYELSAMNLYDGIATISKQDKKYYLEKGCRIPMTDLSFGVNPDKYILTNDYEFPSLFHLGSMDWIPNAEGIQWFIEKVWSLVHPKFPDLKLFLAGRNMPEKIKKMQIVNVEVLGDVSSAIEFINSKAIMIVPLFSGSGIRIKIIEGMALGKAIISTEIGAEGIDYKNEENILIANTPDEFLSAIEKCTSDRNFCDRLGKNARKLIEENYNMPQIIRKLEDFYRQVLQN